MTLGLGLINAICVDSRGFGATNGKSIIQSMTQLIRKVRARKKLWILCRLREKTDRQVVKVLDIGSQEDIDIFWRCALLNFLQAD